MRAKASELPAAHSPAPSPRGLRAQRGRKGARLLGIAAAGSLLPALLAGCTTFGAISWRNAVIVLRQPDAVPNRITAPARPDARLAALWIGHASVLVQLDDKFILTDPVFTRYVGGVSPRLVEPGIAPADLPKIDAALVSHRHFDHLSTGSFPMIENKLAMVLTPPGAAADVPAGRYAVNELAAWARWEDGDLRITAVPVRHSGGRWPGDEASHAAAYTGFVVEYHGMAVFFAGDTAYDASLFEAIAARFPSIGLALLPIGPIEPVADMLPHHMNPAEALAAGRLLRARHVLPIHFATFINSLDEPGAVEAAYRQELQASAPGGPAPSLWRIGEQRVVLAR